MWSMGSVLASSPHLPLWSPRSLSGLWSECCRLPLLSSTFLLACCSTSALPCGPSTPVHGITSSVTVDHFTCSFNIVLHCCHLSCHPVLVCFQRRKGSRGGTSGFHPPRVRGLRLEGGTPGSWGNLWRKGSYLWTSSKPTSLSWWPEGLTRCVCVCVPVCVYFAAW